MSLLPYTRLLHSMGAPVERLLIRAGIPVDLLNYRLPLSKLYALTVLTRGSTIPRFSMWVPQ